MKLALLSLLLLCSCTCSISIVQTDGTASDVIDDTESASVTLPVTL